ncbi:flagellar brake domain-containing protein [Radiobacillus kanasensis]|uniref:flagellar brake protein n=1 Tax=Radiobacillus kanasensis TaxID=2844358 RepID=UPI001E33EA92|nr:flagellar brake domain-containing protein [Radiobacillus kanasensis]UFT97642.1 flagellar brake domain-containing protein [Radiobacillus kanasensis]
MTKIGLPLTLEYGVNGDSELYRCKIVEHEDHLIYVDYPIHTITGRTGVFETGTEFYASFVGKDNSVYQFETQVRAKKNVNIPTLVLGFPGDENLIRIQRRQYVRIESSLDISIHDSEGAIAPFTTVTQDISGGGLSVVLPSNHSVKPGMILDIWMVLSMDSGSNEYIHAKAKAIRVHERDEHVSTLSIKFNEIKDKDRQTVIRYCFEKQLLNRKKGIK